ncbi:MAG: PAC2 family protein [Dehalococcoidia bacterium]|jgi:predicted ATP-grasp superfamily ATP-dependent carboligase|nr:PAC2 family protein [Dehalococcoidia bacterium]MDW8009759.1 PAC2 family protein [Chloroflexota bacterium]
MQVGAFEVVEPLPDLDRPTLILALQPWIDVGSVGTMALAFLEEAWGAQPLAQLSRPGHFYDFTRYRPTLYRRGDRREVTVPNTFVRWCRSQGQGWVLVHALEPHSHGEDYVESLVELMARLGVARYCLIGSYYGPVPHTRPLVITGSSSEPYLLERMRQAGVRESRYEGPTTILTLATEQARSRGIEALSLLVQVPAYAQLERDYRGLVELLQALGRVLEVSLPLERLWQEAERQYGSLDEQVRRDPRLKAWVEDLERAYDQELASQPSPEPPPLSPELERLLEDIERRWEGPPPPAPPSP